MKEYTQWRRFLAWTGFIFYLVGLLLALYLMAGMLISNIAQINNNARAEAFYQQTSETLP